MAESTGREIPIPGVAGSKPIRSKILLIRGLFLFFLISLYKADFSRVFACVCEAQLHFCVEYLRLRL